MKNINGTQYISVKEYAEMKNLTAGRIYQLKNELPFEKFDDLGVELINFDLLQLSEKENSLALAKFQTSQALHTYDYKQLGLLVADMFKTSNEVRTNSEILLREKDLFLVEKLQQIEEMQEKNRNLSVSLEETQFDLSQKNDLLAQKEISLFELETNLIAHQETINLKNTFIETQIEKIKDLEAIEDKITKNYEAKVIENQATANELLLSQQRIETIQKNNERLEAELTEAKTNIASINNKKEELNQLLNDAKQAEQKAIYELDLQKIELKSLAKENESLTKQLAAANLASNQNKLLGERLTKIESELKTKKLATSKLAD